jgi:hypothetical protein
MGDDDKHRSQEKETTMETGKDDSWFFNNKRLADEMLGDSLSEVRKNRHHFDRMVTNSIGRDDERAAISVNALNSAVNSQGLLANLGLVLLGASADKINNVGINEVPGLSVVAKTGIQNDALATLIVAKLTEALKPAQG